jgi:hypothetical protein
VDQLASEQVDPINDHTQDTVPLLVCVPGFRFVAPALPCFPGLLAAGVLPEVVVQVRIAHDRQDQAAVLVEQLDNVPGRIQLQHAGQEYLPALSV